MARDSRSGIFIFGFKGVRFNYEQFKTVFLDQGTSYIWTDAWVVSNVRAAHDASLDPVYDKCHSQLRQRDKRRSI